MMKNLNKFLFITILTQVKIKVKFEIITYKTG